MPSTVKSLLLTGACFLCAEISAEVFTNPILIRKAVLAEVEHVQAFLALLQENISERLQQMLHDYIREVASIEADIGLPLSEVSSIRDAANLQSDVVINSIAGNPIHVFKLAFRQGNLTKAILDDISKEKDLKEETSKRIKALLTAPHAEASSEDILGTALALNRIMYVYALDPQDIAQGQILHVKSNAFLSSKDMIVLAEYAENNKIVTKHGLALAVEWVEAALKLIARNDDPLYYDSILNELKTLRDKHDKAFDHPSETNPNENLFLKKLGDDLNVTGRELRILEDHFFQHSPPKEDARVLFTSAAYKQLCRGISIKSPRERVGEVCYYSSMSHPRLLLNPVKVEALDGDPTNVLVIHGLLSEDDVRYLKFAAIEKFTRGNVEEINAKARTEGKTQRVSHDRTQSHCWLYDAVFPTLEKLSRELDAITGLQVSRQNEISLDKQFRFFTYESEAYQIGIYGTGGLYLPHVDALINVDNTFYITDDRVWVGNRIATAMFYLSDSEDGLVGGGTAFPKWGVGTTPRKGSMAFWYNLHSDGSRESKSLHGGCPAAFGVKWVANKWIREGCQFLTKPCPHKALA